MTNASSWRSSDALQDLALDRMSADEPEDENWPGLPDSMCAVPCLSCDPDSHTHPVPVVEHDRVHHGESDAEPACTRAQEEQDIGSSYQLKDPVPSAITPRLQYCMPQAHSIALPARGKGSLVHRFADKAIRLGKI